MAIRTEILPQLAMANEKINQVRGLIHALENASDTDAKQILAELNGYTGKNYDLDFFQECWGWTDLEDLAFIVALPEPPRCSFLFEEELSFIIKRIQEIPTMPGIIEYYLQLLDYTYSYPAISDLFFSKENESLSVQDIISRIISHRPIQL